MKINDLGSTISQLWVDDTFEFSLNGKCDKEGNVTITSLSIVPKVEDKESCAGFKQNV